MQVTETQRDGLKRAYEITLTAAELDEKVNAKLLEAQPEVQMKGFRKGKVPIALLKKQYGDRVMGEAMQESVDGAMKDHFAETGDRPAQQPDVKMANENWSQGDDVVVALSYEALPDIPEPSLGQIELERMVVKADDQSVQDSLESLAKNAQDFEDRAEGDPAQSGDQVIIDFVGKLDGEPFEGGASEDFPLTLGANQFIPGFEEQLIGVKPGDATTVTVTFPEEYQAEHLAGKETVFDVTVKAVKAPKAAEINDEMAQKFGAEDLESLKGQIRERLESEYNSAARGVMKRHLLDKLDDMLDFQLPPSLVEAEAKQIAHQLHHEENDIAADDHSHGEITPTEEHQRLGERRVRLGLFLADVGQRNEIQVTDQEMQQAVMQQARQYPGQERQFFEFVQKNPQVQEQLRAPIFEDKVCDYIFELAQVTEREVTKDELQKAVEAMEADDDGSATQTVA